MEVFRCTRCGELLPDSAFPRRGGKENHKRRSACRVCINKYQLITRLARKAAAPFKFKASQYRNRSVTLGLPFDLDAAYLESIWTGMCPVFGIEILFGDDVRYLDHGAELDRFIPSRGYVRGNVCFLSRRANRLKDSVSTEELMALLMWMISQGDDEMATPEGAVKAKIKSWLKTLPDCWFYMPVQNGMGVVGIPDIICVIRGRMVAIETKAPGKEKNVTANQQASIDAINNAGGLAFVASDLVTAQNVIRGHGLC